MNDKVQGLINVLLDKTAREDERSDAAMDLAHYKDVRAIQPLTKIASDPFEEITIIDDCAVSIGVISVEVNQFNEELFRKMVPFAQGIIFRYIMAHKPTLFTQSFREEFKQYDDSQKNERVNENHTQGSKRKKNER